MGELLRAVQGQPNILDAFLRAQEYQRQIGQQEQNMRLQLAQQALARMYRQQELDYQNQRLAMQEANYASEDQMRKANMQREGAAAQEQQRKDYLGSVSLVPGNDTLYGPAPDQVAQWQQDYPGQAPPDIAAQSWALQAKAKAEQAKAAKLTKQEYETGGIKVTKFIDPDTGQPAIDPDTGNPMVYTAPRQGPPSLSVVPTYVGPDGSPLLLNPKTGEMRTGELPPGAAPKPKTGPTASTVDYGEGGKQFEKMLAQAQAALQNAGGGETRDSILANYPDEIRALVPNDTDPGFRYQMKRQFVNKYFNKTGGAASPPANAPQPQPQASAPTQGKPLTPEAIKQYAAMGLTKEQAMAQARRDGYVW
jgi:hypothetical protein